MVLEASQRQEPVAVYTLGNLNDALWRPPECDVPVMPFDNSTTQIIDSATESQLEFFGGNEPRPVGIPSVGLIRHPVGVVLFLLEYGTKVTECISNSHRQIFESMSGYVAEKIGKHIGAP